MRFVIYGAGAVGGTIGARLAQHGNDVALIARGAHAAAIGARGLQLRSPDDEITVRVPVAEHPDQIHWRHDDVVVLAMKSQDTTAALGALGAHAPAGITVVCAQNGVANERMALRRFPNVMAMCVMLPASHSEPGVVEASSAPISGLLDVGRYPGGVDQQVEAIASALSAATFESLARPDAMRWKYTKLLMNLANAVEAACGSAPDDDAQEAGRLARDEGRRVLLAAGIDHATADEDAQRRGDKLRIRPVGGARRGGGSSWQSLARGTGAIEADYLNGEIVLLGRTHGVATPVNAALQRVANDLARSKQPPGSMTGAELLAALTA